MTSLLEVQDLKKHFVGRSGIFGGSKKTVRAVDGVSFTVSQGETLGLVGESGCGKSTLVKTLLYLEVPTSGKVYYDGRQLTEKEAMRLRRQAQIVFQDPYTSLPPRMRVRDIVADPLLIHRLADRRSVRKQVDQLLEDVGLQPETGDQYPYQFSGGMRQRVGIARALAVQPSLVVADEAVSALDVSVQAQILNLFKDLQERHNLTYIFVSHDLGVVKYMSHRIAVMYLGEIVELAATEELHKSPLNPYTRALLSAIPSIHGDGRERIRLEGEPPDPGNPPPGCKFHPRCPVAQQICAQEAPELKEWLPEHSVACHFALTDSGQV
ncbi:MAG TPA: oligopeptide/dipeptide ABC transporter ATP-binding protein [Anaerolineae bacterium]|nr:oligopeptide/dipeptide ABC transporter ATP-binding protein [Anaerolineae bacterium]